PGFDGYNRRVARPGGFYLPNPAKDRVWNTGNGKANFSSAELSAFQVGSGRFVLQTLRSHDQFNTTVYGPHDRYRGISNGRRIVFLNPEDLAELCARPLQPLDLTSHWEDGERHVKGFLAVPYDMPKGTAAAYFPEANPLVPVGSYAEHSHTPTSKAVEISIRVSS
ncbi:MAG: hypothetical protein AAGB14_12540, partial [Verrucomicrobiota bacterium]